MKITTHLDSGDERSFTLSWSPADDPSGALADLAASGRLECLLRELGQGESLDHLPQTAAEMEMALHTVRDALAGLELRRRLLMAAARARFRPGFPLRELGGHAGLATMTARRWLEQDRGRWPELRPEADNEVRVLLTVGDQAELVTCHHPATAPLRVPSERIARQADIPVNELPGRRFTVEHLTKADADGFGLVDDPRR